MAITYDAGVNFGASIPAGLSSGTLTHTPGAGTNRLLVVGLAAGDSSATSATGQSFGALSYGQAAGSGNNGTPIQHKFQTNACIDLWYFTEAQIAARASDTLNFSLVNTKSCIPFAITFYGVDPGTSFSGIVTQLGTNGAFNAAVASAVGDLVAAFFYVGNPAGGGNSTLTTPAPETLVGGAVGPLNTNQGFAAITTAPGAASVTIADSWSKTSQPGSLVALSLKAASTNTAPIVTVTQPPAGAYPSGVEVQCKATASDSQDGALAAYVEVSTDGGNTYAQPVACPTTITPADGSVRLRFTSAADTGGLTATPATRDLTIGGNGGGTTLILEDEMQQEVLQSGVAATVAVALVDSAGTELTTNPLAPGDVTLSINGGAPGVLSDDANAASWPVVNDEIQIPIASIHLPAAGDKVRILIKDRNGTAFRPKRVHILVSSYTPAIADTKDDIATATAGKLLLTPANRLDTDAAGKVKTAATADSSGVTTLLSRLSATRAGYLDALAVAGLVSSQTDVQSLQFNTRVDVPIPPQLIRPASGSPAIVYQVPINLYDSVGNMEAPDSTPTLTAALADGTSLNANVGALTNPGTGRYLATYTVASTHPKSQVIFTLTVQEGGVSRAYTRSFVVVEDILLSFTLGDRTILQALDDRLDDPRAALLDNLARLDVASSTLTTPAQARAQADAALTAYGAAKPGAAMALTTTERDTLAGVITSFVGTTGSLSTDDLAKLMQTLVYGTASGAAANGGAITMAHPSIAGLTLVINPDQLGNRAAAGTLTIP